MVNEFSTYLKVTGCEERVSEKDLEYKICTFEEVNLKKVSPNEIEEFLTGKKATRLFFGNKKDSARLDNYFDGKIVEYKTTTYINSKGDNSDTISIVVFSNENGLELAAKSLSYYGAFPYDEKGNIYKYERTHIVDSQNQFSNEEDELSDHYETDGSYSYNGWSKAEIDDIFDGDPEATWNVD